MKKLVMLLFVVALVYACSKSSDDGGMKKAGTPILKVNSVVVTNEQLQEELSKLPPNLRGFFTGKEGINRFVDEIKKREILYLEAKKNGLDKDPEFKKKMDDFKRMNLINAIITKNLNPANMKVTPEEAKEYYEKNKSELQQPGQLRASHILVQTEDEANDIYSKLKKGAKFEELAKEYSQDKMNAGKGGDLGYFSKGQMEPNFDAAAFKLDKGEISKPVKTAFGWHIIKVTDSRPAKQMGFEEVKGMIMQGLTQDKQKKAFETYFSSIEKNYKVDLDSKALSDFVAKHTSVTEKHGKTTTMEKMGKTATQEKVKEEGSKK
ncbi:MAG: peptidylprolyl isomerase [Nitrospirae bacterium]|nr:peptidylprolyl isomerase [Nitrospirota bacterium]